MDYTIINTCGTSVLTNPARNDSQLFQMLIKYSNARKESEIPTHECNAIYEHWNKLIDEWSKKSIQEAKHDSAELNSLLTWQHKHKINNHYCRCYLVHTDTLLGALAAQLVEQWLHNQDYSGVVVQPIESLLTNDINVFESGLSNLAKWAFEIKDSYSYSTIIFNTAGGYKAVAGFMQTLGTFIADKTIYMFESVDNVLEIPRLPISWGVTDEIRKNIADYRKVALQIPLSSYAHLNALWVKDGRFTPWGEIAWGNAKPELYSEEIFNPIIGNIVFGKDFHKSVKGLAKERIAMVNERLDDLTRLVLSNGKYNPLRLDYKPLRGAAMYTHECDAWADQDAKRLFCNQKGNTIYVEKLDKALH